MTEYWKSTPNYWCKFCKVYVKDTKFERQNHEATARHQGNIQKSLRDLHRGKEREEREKKFAKDEVARLNGIFGGGGPSKPVQSKPITSTTTPRVPPRQATADDRKRQMEQLVTMGVAIPDEYRQQMAMVGEWQTVSVRQVDAKEDGDSKETAFQGRKHAREPKEDEEDEEEVLITKKPKKSWSSQLKSARPDIDFSEMLALPVPKKDESEVDEEKPDVKVEDEETVPTEENSEAVPAEPEAEETEAKDDEQTEAPIVFKKRKAKPVRDK